MPVDTEIKRVDAQWKKSKKQASALNLRVNALGERFKILSDAIMISAAKQIQLPNLLPWINDFKQLQKDDQRLQKIVADVELGKLGLRESEQKPGDIDVMAPPGTTEDELVDYNIGWVLIAIGVVVAIGLVAIFAYKTAKANQLKNQYLPLYNYCDNKLSGDPEWEAKKRSVFSERKSTWERLENAANRIVGGASTGLMIAIPVAALVLMSWLKK